MRHLSRAELTLILIPVLVAPIAIAGQKWKVANTPLPSPLPIPTPTPRPNLYSIHYAQTKAILPSPDGKIIHTGEENNKTRFSTWDARSGDLIRRFGVFHYSNADAVLSPDGTILGFEYGGWKGDRVVLFDSATGKEKLQIKKPKATGYGFDLNNHVVALPTGDDVRFFSTRNGSLVGKLRHRADEYYPKEPQFSLDGKQILWIGYSDRDYDSYANGNSSDEIVWFDWEKRKLINSVEFPKTFFYQACFSGDGKVILALGYRRYWVKKRGNKNEVAADARFFAIDARTGKLMYTWLTRDWSKAIAVSPDGKWFAFSGNNKGSPQSDKSLSVYEVRTGKENCDLDAWISPAAWSADSKTLYVGSSIMQRFRLQSKVWSLYKG